MFLSRSTTVIVLASIGTGSGCRRRLFSSTNRLPHRNLWTAKSPD